MDGWKDGKGFKFYNLLSLIMKINHRKINKIAIFTKMKKKNPMDLVTLIQCFYFVLFCLLEKDLFHLDMIFPQNWQADDIKYCTSNIRSQTKQIPANCRLKSG